MDLKTIMVHPELERPNDGLFALTADLAQRPGAAEIIGIAGCQPIQLVHDETYVAGEIMAADRGEIEVEMKRAQQRFRDVFKGDGKAAGMVVASGESLVLMGEWTVSSNERRELERAARTGRFGTVPDFYRLL